MILLLDDDQDLLATMKEVLEDEGFAVEAFSDPVQALEFASSHVPKLVVCDIRMPGMDGFRFHDVLRRKVGEVPFVFLSSLSEPATVVQGLEAGADDYIAKPVDWRVFVAKVRAVLRRRSGTQGLTFEGDLSRLPFDRLLKFCEEKGLTGTLSLATPEVQVDIPLQGGLVADEDALMEVLDQLMGAAEGTFTIAVAAPDFSGIAHAARKPEEARRRDRSRPSVCPTGMLGGIRVGPHLVQIQTECVSDPVPTVTSEAVFRGRVLARRATPIPPEMDRAGAAEFLRRHHRAFEQEIAEKFERLPEPQRGSQPDRRDRFEALMEEGVRALRARDLRRALEVFSEAAELDPDDRLVQANLTLLKQKLSER